MRYAIYYKRIQCPPEAHEECLGDFDAKSELYIYIYTYIYTYIYIYICVYIYIYIYT